jgi:hypothetical protein
MAHSGGADQDRRRVGGVSVASLGVAVAVIAATISAWQAWEASRSASDQREVAQRATADQVVILGEEAEIPTRSGGGRSSWSVFAETPTRVQNYGRLPVSDVVVQIDLYRPKGDPITYLVPVGPLPPCREVRVLDQDSLYRSGTLRDVERVQLRVHFVDPAGYRWVRATSGAPMTDTGPPKRNVRTNADLVRSEQAVLKPCGGS